MSDVITIPPLDAKQHDSTERLISRLPQWIYFSKKNLTLHAEKLYIENLEMEKLPKQIVSIISTEGKIESFSWVPWFVYESIILDDNWIEKIPSNFFDLICSYLSLNGNLITECAINFLTCTKLSMETNTCSKITFTGSKINHLILTDNKLESLDDLPIDLIELNLTDNCFECDFVIECPTLIKLHLSKNALTSINLMLTPNLEYLNLSDNAFASFELSNVKLPDTLKTLILTNNMISSIGNDCLPDGLEYLDISHNILEEFNIILPSYLKTLKINNNKISYAERVFKYYAVDEIDCSNMFDIPNDLCFVRSIRVRKPVHEYLQPKPIVPKPEPESEPESEPIVYAQKTLVPTKWEYVL